MLIVHLTRQQKETASAYAKRMRYLERYVHILPEFEGQPPFQAKETEVKKYVLCASVSQCGYSYNESLNTNVLVVQGDSQRKCSL